MTPNQIDGIAEATTVLLHEAHRELLVPAFEPVTVREMADTTGRYLVTFHGKERDGDAVRLSIVVAEDGSHAWQDAAWTDQRTTPDPAGRPGVRRDATGAGLYSAAWLND